MFGTVEVEVEGCVLRKKSSDEQWMGVKERSDSGELQIQDGVGAAVSGSKRGCEWGGRTWGEDMGGHGGGQGMTRHD